MCMCVCVNVKRIMSSRKKTVTPSGNGKKRSTQSCASAFMAKGISSHEHCTHLDLSGHYPPINIIDESIQDFVMCEKISLSSNNIEKIQNLPGNNSRLKVLSLGRNIIKKLDGIHSVKDTLEQLWISYNNIEKLDGIEELHHLQVLYISNNKISDWEEIDRLSGLMYLTDILLIGNPLHLKYKKKNMLSEYEREVMRRLPRLKKLDGRILAQHEGDDDIGSSLESRSDAGGRECHIK